MLPGGGTDEYMRFGDTYVKRSDGALDVVRNGAKEWHSYASGDWLNVEGDERKLKSRHFRR
jgi:uncharacterized protein YaiE (UPF0345 family)